MITASVPMPLTLGGQTITYDKWGVYQFSGQRTGPLQLRVDAAYERCLVLDPQTGATSPYPDLQVTGTTLRYSVPNIYAGAGAVLSGPNGNPWVWTDELRALAAAWIAAGEAFADAVALAAGGT